MPLRPEPSGERYRLWGCMANDDDEDDIHLEWREEVRNANGKVRSYAQWFIIENGRPSRTGIEERSDRETAEGLLETYKRYSSIDATRKRAVQYSRFAWLRPFVSAALARPKEFAGTRSERSDVDWCADAVVGALEHAMPRSQAEQDRAAARAREALRQSRKEHRLAKRAPS